MTVERHRRPGALYAALLVLGAGVCLVLASLWVVAAAGELSAPVTTSGHHDFLAFYAVASLVRSHHAASLYDPAVITAMERRIFPHPTGFAGYMPFNNPPVAAVLLSPLAAVGEAPARLVWLGVNVAMALVCVALATAGRRPVTRLLAVLLVLGTFPAYQALIEGQWSFVLLVGCLAALLAARTGHTTLAGAALAVLWLEAQLLVLVLAFLLVSRHWRTAAAMVATVVAATLLTLPWAGPGVEVAYLHHLGGVLGSHVGGAGAAGATAWEGGLTNMEGLIGLGAALFGQRHAVAVDAFTAVMSLALLAYLGWALRDLLRTRRPLSLPSALALVCAGMLLDPHLYGQDCLLAVVLVALLLASPLPRGAGAWPHREEAAVLVGAALLLDLAAIDTLWIQGSFPAPLHLFTLALLAGALVLPWPDARARCARVAA